MFMWLPSDQQSAYFLLICYFVSFVSDKANMENKSTAQIKILKLIYILSRVHRYCQVSSHIFSIKKLLLSR